MAQLVITIRGGCIVEALADRLDAEPILVVDHDTPATWLLEPRQDAAEVDRLMALFEKEGG